MTETDFRSRSLAVRSDARRMLEELRAKRIAQPRWQPTRSVRATVQAATAELPDGQAEAGLADAPAMVAALDAVPETIALSVVSIPAVSKKTSRKKARKPKLAKREAKPEVEPAEAVTVPPEPAIIEPPQPVEMVPPVAAAQTAKPKRPKRSTAKAIPAAALPATDLAEEPAPPAPVAVAPAVEQTEPKLEKPPVTKHAKQGRVRLAAMLPKPMTAVPDAPKVQPESVKPASLKRPARFEKTAPTASAPKKREAASLATLASIGPGMVWRLGQLGVLTLDDLAKSDTPHLRKSLGAIGALVNVDALIAEAKSRLN